LKRRFFQSHDAALKWVARMKNVTPEKLRKRVPPRILAERFKALQSLDGTTPLDLEDLVSRHSEVTRMSQVASILVPLVVQAKLGPWRALMFEGWQTLSTVQGPMSRSDGIKLAVRILQYAIRHMAQSSAWRALVRPWNSWNKGVQHHSGFIPLCLNLGLLRKGGSLDLGMEDVYSIVAGKDDIEKVKEKLDKMADAWDAVSSVLSCPPKTCQEWASQMLEAFKIFRQHGAPRLNPKVGMYLPGWTLRSYMVMMMRAHGVPRLQRNGIGVRALVQVNPDQRIWFTVLEQHVKTTTALRRLFGNSSPPELLSCYLCV